MSTAKLFDKTIGIDTYRKLKLEMLRKEFKIGVTCAEEEHLNTLLSEIAIDNYCRKIISNHWKN
jgi:hypothetical protein